jgi:hypothetical protein
MQANAPDTDASEGFLQNEDDELLPMLSSFVHFCVSPGCCIRLTQASMDSTHIS